jgi:type I restriction enzyme, S subunit
MRSHYKKLGPYIRQVDIRNSAGKEENLLGVSTQKVFIESIANTVGTDFTKYKVVKKGQFTYVPDTSRRGDRIGIALLESHAEGLVSNVYTVFEVVDPNQLDPEYLMMWFRRPEFDRYARYMSHGSVRETFGWEEMCEVELPIPPLAKQREIVREYNTIVNRIKLNEQLNQKLEETAQALYQHWFVDFEFPISAEYAAAIGQPELEGKPYKSSGGEMVYNVELDREIPRDWHVKKIFDLCEIGSSRRIFESEYVEDGIPFYRGKEVILKKNGSPIRDGLFITKERYEEVKKKSGKPAKGDILLTAVGTLGVSYLVQEEEFYFKDGNVIWLKNFSSPIINLYLYDFMQSSEFENLIEEITIGSTQSAITIATLGERKIILPGKSDLNQYRNICLKLNESAKLKKEVGVLLHGVKEVLLSNMVRQGI